MILELLEIVRIIVNTGRGNGHQYAAFALMEELRRLGFRGIFDIQCDDKIGAELDDKYLQPYINTKPLVSPRLIAMIPELQSSPCNEEGAREVPRLGKVKISSYVHKSSLPEVDLTICAADDNYFVGDFSKLPEIYNTKYYISLQPTDWHYFYFVVNKEAVTLYNNNLPKMRLPSSSLCKDLSSVTLSPTEQRILNLINNDKINSQLVYGLYSSNHCIGNDSEGPLYEDSGHLQESTEVKLVIKANIEISHKTGKPSILLLPQEIALDSFFRNNFIVPRTFY